MMGPGRGGGPGAQWAEPGSGLTPMPLDPHWRRMEFGARATEAQPAQLWMSPGPEPSLPVIYSLICSTFTEPTLPAGRALGPLTKCRLVTQRFLSWRCSHCSGRRHPCSDATNKSGP